MNESRLFQILGLKRGHGSDGERKMIEEVIMPYNPTVFFDDTEEIAYYIEVGTGSRTLFSAHTDTVHGRGSKFFATMNKIVPFDDNVLALPKPDPTINKYHYNTKTDTVHAVDECLGADNGAGITLLLEMIDAGVAGHYLFHRGEECGGIGSGAMAKEHKDFIGQFDRAIAFDRRGTYSVISHQSACGRCCSDKFATELANRLSDDKYFFAPDNTGSFTDTAKYVGLIGECTNVSVGYDSEHGSNESLDMTYFRNLCQVCIDLEWETLPIDRKPGEVDELDLYDDWLFRRGYAGGTYKGMKQQDYDKEFEYYGKKGAKQQPKDTADVTINDLYDMDYVDLEEFVYDDHVTASRLLWTLMWGQDPYASTVEDDMEDEAIDDKDDDDKLDVGMR
jgi:hypothetical protein